MRDTHFEVIKIRETTTGRIITPVFRCVGQDGVDEYLADKSPHEHWIWVTEFRNTIAMLAIGAVIWSEYLDERQRLIDEFISTIDDTPQEIRNGITWQ